MPGFDDPAKVFEKVSKEYVDANDMKGEGEGPAAGLPEGSEASHGTEGQVRKSAGSSRRAGSGRKVSRAEGSEGLVMMRVTARTKAMLALYRSICKTGRESNVFQYDVVEEAVKAYILRKAPEMKQMIELLFVDEQ